jgi:predicted transcriptional regulator
MSTPDEVEPLVLGLIKEYLQKKPFFSIEDIVTYINNRTRAKPYVNKNKIEKIIKRLIKKRRIIPGTKLMKNNIIEHPIRNEIFNFVKKNPSNINEIMRALNIGSNQTLWHLSCLEKFQFTRSRDIENQRIIFLYESDPELDEIYFYLNQDIVQEILDLMIQEKESLKVSDISNQLKKNYNTIKKYLQILRKLRIISIEKDKKRTLFKLNYKEYDKFQDLIIGGKK